MTDTTTPLPRDPDEPFISSPLHDWEGTDVMRLAIADPPYLGRAALWYGGKGRNKQGSVGRAAGRGHLAPEFHPDAAVWDDPEQHRQLLADLELGYDGWAMAASAKTLPLIASAIPRRARIAVWRVTNAIPDGSRVASAWEPVVVRVPEGRRAHGTGHAVPDVLLAPHPQAGFVGTKPDAWTRWVLDMLGYQTGDEVYDLFPGSGAVTRAMQVLL